MKLFFGLGPGDIVGARRAALAGEAIQETSIAFSEQLFSFCRAQGIAALAISSNSRRDDLTDGSIRTENRPHLIRGSGIRFHMSMLIYAAYLAFRARRFGADLAIIDSGTTHYFALTAFWLLGIPVAVNLHNVLWPSGFPPDGRVSRTIFSLNAMFFRHIAVGAIGVSPECEKQVRKVARYPIPFYQYRCQFLDEGFRSGTPYQGETFRIAFVGRAEVDKGLLDLIDIANQLRSVSDPKFVFDACGDGTALSELKKKANDCGLHDLLIIHGRLERSRLLDIYANAHAVIVPTRSTFCEGMPQACAEAMLSCLPVVTSQVTNAFDVIGPACVRAETNDIDSYVRAIRSLAERPEFYDRLRSECPRLSRQFLDMEQGYGAAVRRLISDLFQIAPGLRPRSSRRLGRSGSC